MNNVIIKKCISFNFVIQEKLKFLMESATTVVTWKI